MLLTIEKRMPKGIMQRKLCGGIRRLQGKDSSKKKKKMEASRKKESKALKSDYNS